MSPLILLLLAIALPLTLATAQPAPAPAPVKEDDVRCLRGVKRDLRDPNARLSSWTFTNTSAGAICDFSGVSCWNPQESRIIALSLSGFGLQGAVPSPLKYCRSTTTLDLSNNSLSGPIPPALCDWLPFLVTLDLSGNRFSGPIPSELANCRFLNSLKLNGNALTGQIPASLSGLVRLSSLDLSNNRLEGKIPPQLGAAFPKETFSGNPEWSEDTRAYFGAILSCNLKQIMHAPAAIQQQASSAGYVAAMARPEVVYRVPAQAIRH